MHPRNVYCRKKLDFDVLVERHPELKKYLLSTSSGSQGRRFAWESYDASRELARVLLLEDYGVRWNLPDGHLCPSIPNRANYVHWIEDLLQLSDLWHVGEAGDKVTGVDIGCGANCIYPLLGASVNGWNFIAVDVNEHALRAAGELANENAHLRHLIHVRDAKESPFYSEDKSVLKSALLPGETVTFTMCNPPFFSTSSEAGLNPRTNFGGTNQEMVYPGGEEKFVQRMILESLELKSQAHWFTSMVGKKSSLKALRKLLYTLNVPALRTTEFVQGRTHRWGIAWSFKENASSAMKPIHRNARDHGQKRKREVPDTTKQ